MSPTVPLRTLEHEEGGWGMKGRERREGRGNQGGAWDIVRWGDISEVLNSTVHNVNETDFLKF